MSRAIYRLNTMAFKIPKTHFIEVEQIITKFVWNHKRFWIAKAIF